MNFWKMFFASLVGSIIAIFTVGLILIFLFMVTLTSSISGAMSGGEEEIKNVKNNSVLEINFDGPIVERGLKDGPAFDLASLGGSTVKPLGLNNILARLRYAATDDKIKGVYLNFSGVSGGFSAITDIRDELMKFKESGKWMVAYSEGFSQGGYYLASAADEVYLYPEGGMEMNGLNAELMFYKDMLEKVGVDIQVLRGPNNKYKSAVEPYFRNDMSEASRLQYQELLNDLWSIMVTDISESRGVSVDKLNMIADSISIRMAEDAVTEGLVDALKYGDEVTALLKEKLALEGDDDIEFITLSDYRAKINRSESKDEIAVVYAVGPIESGEGDDATIGSDRIAEALRNARLDENTKAVVLRVNSPGGSALASDVIWRETELLKRDSIPLIVSMGDLAASGGYYISCEADKILASDATITGSIGVFGMLPNAKTLLEEKIGVHTDRVGTNANGNIGVFSPLNDTQHAAITESIVDVYEDFTGKVADGRGMTVDQVDAVGQGRVWSGTDAIDAGLVDEIGTLERAKEIAAELAGLTEYRTKDYPRLKDPFQELLKELGADVRMEKLGEELGVDAATIREINTLLKQKDGVSIQARMPYSLIIK
ncbi:MAG: signal peptide peptidase SppA [Flavobacteriales bacterium]